MEWLATFAQSLGQPPSSKAQLRRHQQRRLKIRPAISSEGHAIRPTKRIPHDRHLVHSLRRTEEGRTLGERHLQTPFGIEGSRVGMDRNRDTGLLKQKFNIPIASGRSDHDFPAAILQSPSGFRKTGVQLRRIRQLHQISFVTPDTCKNFAQTLKMSYLTYNKFFHSIAFCE